MASIFVILPTVNNSTSDELRNATGRVFAEWASIYLVEHAQVPVQVE